ncbi:poly(A)-binding protein binding protein [Lecanora helva]
MATTMVNGGSNPEVNSPVTMPTTGKQQTSKSTAGGGKALDTSRKQTSNPGDGAQRRNVPPKAWTGLNPITQRASTPSHPNGAGPQPKSNNAKTSLNSDSRNNDQHTHERMLHLLGNFMGNTATIALKNGDVFSGIFFGANMETNDPAYLLKMVQKTRPAGKAEANGVREESDGFVGVGEDHAMSFDVKDISGLTVEGVDIGAQDRLPNGSTAGFRTDADISGNLAVRERQLQRWAPSADTDVDLSLEASGSSGEWDQFKANEKLFGLKSDYDENIYTTTIDRSKPSYREREARAQRLANEIEGTSSSNSHVREERGLINEEGEFDEEDNGVRRHGADYPPLQSSQANRYMPPARRPPTGKPTVAGAPVDPAIISSQIARADPSPQGRTAAPSKAVEPSAVTAPTSGQPILSEANRDPVKDSATSNVAAANAATTARPSDAAKVAAPAPAPNAAATVETEVRDAFRNFASVEKNRVAEDRRKRVNQDKAIKLNDLKKFSTNFKLHTPVPKDLVPILAKDPAKQHEIVEKAQHEAEQKVVTPPKSLASSAEQITPSKHDGTRAPPNTANAERQEFAHPRQGFPPRGPQAVMTSRDKQQQFSTMYPPGSHGMLSHRLADNHGRHKAGMPVSIPAPLPIHGAQKPPSRPSVNAVPSSQASSTVRTPTSAVSAKFNVNARDFKPNPAANSFKPNAPSTTSSPRSGAIARPVSRETSPSDFFGDKKPLPPEERPSILENFNPLKRLKEKAQTENKTKDYAANGGIVYAHATPVTWTQVDDPDKNFKHYKDMFDDPPAPQQGASPQNTAASPVNSALLHQLPPHLQHGSQGIPQVQAPQQPHYQGPPQPQHYPAPNHYDDHRMRSSPSASSAFNTPRAPGTYLAYPQAIGQPMQYPNGQPVPPYAIGPGVQQPQNFRQYPGGATFPHSPGQQFTAPMMVHNSSQGSYMAAHPMSGPPMHMFPPGQVPAYGGPPQAPSGYPSPGRATPMMHQGSYQGQNPQMYMNGQQYGAPIYAQQPPQHSTPMRGYASPQTHFSQSPQQQPHFPPQVSRVPSNSYVHHPQGQYQHMQGQHPHPPPVPVEGGDSMK